MLKKHLLYFLLGFLLLFSTSCGGRSLRQEWRDEVTANRVAETSVAPVTVADFASRVSEIEQQSGVKTTRKSLARQEKEMNKAIQALQGMAYSHEILGLKYLDYKLYELALKEFQAALALHPHNYMILYYAGISSGWLASTQVDATNALFYYTQAEHYLNMAHRQKNDHLETLLALATLYLYEIKDIDKAATTIQKIKGLSLNNSTGLFLEASLSVAQGNPVRAIQIYTQIANTSNNAHEKQQALESITLLNQRK
jgi:tetratricopeptide (TPR) repeat protein